jgi:hypothetical protein
VEHVPGNAYTTKPPLFPKAGGAQRGRSADREGSDEEKEAMFGWLVGWLVIFYGRGTVGDHLTPGLPPDFTTNHCTKNETIQPHTFNIIALSFGGLI